MQVVTFHLEDTLQQKLRLKVIQTNQVFSKLASDALWLSLQENLKDIKSWYELKDEKTHGYKEFV